MCWKQPRKEGRGSWEERYVQVRLSLVQCAHEFGFNSVGIRETSDRQRSEAATEGKTKDRNHRPSCGMQPRQLSGHKSASALPRTMVLQYVAPS